MEVEVAVEKVGGHRAGAVVVLGFGFWIFFIDSFSFVLFHSFPFFLFLFFIVFFFFPYTPMRRHGFVYWFLALTLGEIFSAFWQRLG